MMARPRFRTPERTESPAGTAKRSWSTVATGRPSARAAGCPKRSTCEAGRDLHHPDIGMLFLRGGWTLLRKKGPRAPRLVSIVVRLDGTGYDRVHPGHCPALSIRSNWGWVPCPHSVLRSGERTRRYVSSRRTPEYGMPANRSLPPQRGSGSHSGAGSASPSCSSPMVLRMIASYFRENSSPVPFAED